MKKSTNHHLFSIFMFIFVCTFYLFFALYDGVVICVDSQGYIGMSIAREPLYPIFLTFLRFLFSSFSSDFYLTAAVFLQSTLAAFSAWYFADYILHEFRTSRLSAFFILCIPMLVSLLCRFAAKRGSMYSNSILTEGLTIPCYFLFFRFLTAYCLHRGKSSFISCWFFALLLISTRKQMSVALIMLALGILYGYFKDKHYLKGITLSLLCIISVLLGTFCLDFGYNYALRGEFTRHSGDTRFVTTMAIYTAQRSDAQYIADEDIRNLFLEIYDICDKNGYLKSAAPKGWANRVSHFGDYYDCIQIDNLRPMVSQFAMERYDGDLVAASEYADQIMNTINHSIILHNLPQIISTFADNILSGLITTVAQRNPILNWYSLTVYLLYIALFIWHFLVAKDSKLILLVSLVMVSIIINVGLVSLVIFCQTRYTIYNMALFYISLFLMLREPVRRISSVFHPLHSPTASFR